MDAKLCRTFLAHVYFEDESDSLHRNEVLESKTKHG